MNLNSLGFEFWKRSFDIGDNCDGFEYARVTAVDRGSCLVHDGKSEVPAEVSGKLLYSCETQSELPCVGDWVHIRHYNDQSAAIIHKVLPRKTSLKRKNPGSGSSVQMIAANIDTAFIVQSCQYDFNPNRLERTLVMVSEGGPDPVVLLTKSDLVDLDERMKMLGVIKCVTQAPVIALSSVSGMGLDEVKQRMHPGATCCLLGSSGVGKTTLMNLLLGRDVFKTGDVSGTGEGTHTTTRRQLIILPGDGLIIDTPGMRELGVAEVQVGLDSTFDEVVGLAKSCRFDNCTHRNEPGCAVSAALESGELSPQRYQNYLKLRKEAEFFALSQQERRKNDRAFGRHMKLSKKLMAK